MLLALQPLGEQSLSLHGKRPLARLVLLSLLLLTSIVLYLLLSVFALPREELITPFLLVWISCFLPYLAACAFVLLTKPGHWLELVLIFVGALVFRAMLLPQLPALSHDSWRYLWDARVILHGYSPYIYSPDSGVLKPLHDALIYGNTGFRDVPTIYPPAAQAIYVLSYLLAPSDLHVLKGIFICFDMVTCGVLALLLQRKGLDPRRVIIYAWCPLPIVEFAIEGHLDAITLTFIVLAILFSTSNKRGARVLTGLFIALGTLSKFYPLLLLVVVVRRRDYALLATCFTTILVAYIPFLILGHGQAFGFFATYASEQRQNAGMIQLAVRAITQDLLHLNRQITVIVEYSLDLLIVGASFVLILVQRLRERITMETAALLLTGVVFAVSSHIFPWYTSGLLIWVPLLAGPLWTRKGLSGQGIAIAAVWYFVCTLVLGYFFRATLEWTIYYTVVYDVTLVELALAAVIWFARLHRFPKLRRVTE